MERREEKEEIKRRGERERWIRKRRNRETEREEGGWEHNGEGKEEMEVVRKRRNGERKEEGRGTDRGWKICL